MSAGTLTLAWIFSFALLIATEKIDANETILTQALVSLLENSQCTIFLINLKTDVPKYLGQTHTNLDFRTQQPSFVVGELGNVRSLLANTGHHSCLIGVSTIDNEIDMQSAFMKTRRSQLVFFANQNHTLANMKLQRSHSPLVVLQSFQTQVTATSLCKDRNGVLFNIFKHSVWVKQTDGLKAMDVQRLCNYGGKHPLSGQTLKASLFTHLTADIVKDIASVYERHFNLRFKLYPSSGWYNFNSKGELIGGSLGKVAKRTVDLSLEASLLIASNFGDTSTYTYVLDLVFAELKPSELPRYFNILYPLDSSTWIWFASSLLAISLALHLARRWRNPMSQKKHNLKSFALCLEMAYGAIFQEYTCLANCKKPMFLTLRLLWVTMSMLIVMTFSSNLKSSLIRKNLEKRTMTMDQIIDKDMVVHTDKNALVFYQTALGQVQQINKRLLCQALKKNSVYDVRDGIHTDERIIQQGGAILTYKYSWRRFKSQFLRKRKDFPIIVIPERKNQPKFTMTFRKYDPRATFFDWVIVAMHETGVTQAIMDRYTLHTDMKQPEIYKEEKLILEHFLIPGIFWLVGSFVSVITFTLERLRSKNQFVSS